jgi:hypothetical protein
MGKIRIATPGEGAVGADESPLIRPVGKRPGNDDQPWIAAGVSRRQRKAQAALPANVIKLVPRNLTVRRPPLGKPAVVIVMAEVRRAAS